MTSALRRPSGKFRVGTIVMVAQPVWSVRTSTPVRAHAYGRPVTLTSASRTTLPRVSETWKRPTSVLRLVIRFGVNFTPSMISRAGKLTLDAGIDVWPFCSLIAPCGPGCETTPVGEELAELEPLESVAATTTRNVAPTSADCTVYVCVVAPAMLAQLLLCASQRCHWYVNVGVVVPFHVPGPAVRV